MLTIDEFRTICAALRYWREEMCPHGSEAAHVYLEAEKGATLASHEVQGLRQRLLSASLRFATVNPQKDQIEIANLFEYAADAKAQSPNASHLIAAVLIPAEQ